MKKGGFTLIELLVVISIIGLLSSVVLVAMKSARSKSNDATIMQELVQFRNLYELAFSDTGGYSTLQTTTISDPCDRFNSQTVGFFCSFTTSAKCDNAFGPTSPIIANNQTADNLCKNIVANSGFFYIGVNSNTSMSQKYSISAYLPSRASYMCLGSSKTNSYPATVNYSNSPLAPQDTSNGCSADPRL